MNTTTAPISFTVPMLLCETSDEVYFTLNSLSDKIKNIELTAPCTSTNNGYEALVSFDDEHSALGFMQAYDCSMSEQECLDFMCPEDAFVV